MDITVALSEMPHPALVAALVPFGILLTVDPRTPFDTIARAIVALPPELRIDARQALVASGVLPARYWGVELGEDS
jgi:hypothetical protein